MKSRQIGVAIVSSATIRPLASKRRWCWGHNGSAALSSRSQSLNECLVFAYYTISPHCLLVKVATQIIWTPHSGHGMSPTVRNFSEIQGHLHADDQCTRLAKGCWNCWPYRQSQRNVRYRFVLAIVE